MQTLTLRVNGRDRRVRVSPSAFLVDVLRNDLALTGTKYACGMGECGACTVLVDGEAVYSCLILASEVGDAEITTIEGLAVGDELDAVQAAFADTGGVQCGFCTPGMILSAKALLADHPDPTDADIRIGLSGNLCRCTGYTKIVEAVMTAARKETP